MDNKVMIFYVICEDKAFILNAEFSKQELQLPDSSLRIRRDFQVILNNVYHMISKSWER